MDLSISYTFNTNLFPFGNYLSVFCICGGGLVTKSCPTLGIPETVACRASLSMGFSRQENWSELLFCSPEGLPNPGIKPRSPALQADSFPTELQGKLSLHLLFLFFFCLFLRFHT